MGNNRNLKNLKKVLVTLFSTYGTPNEISNDGGPPFNSHAFGTFMERWGINIRKSSAYYAQSNGRAELAVKVAKRILSGNSDVNGNIDNDRVSRALLQYRNTPIEGIELSPAQVLYGRVLKDHMPSREDALKVRKEWLIAADEREIALRKRHVRMIESYNEHVKPLVDLRVNDCVAVQNQNGNCPKRWDKTGVVIEKLPFRQYRIKMDGSGRITLRNRKFIQKILPACSDNKKVPVPNNEHTRVIADGQRRAEVLSPSPVQLRNNNNIQNNSPNEQPRVEPAEVVPPNLPVEEAQHEIRRSSRMRVPRKLFNAQHFGKTHLYSSPDKGE